MKKKRNIILIILLIIIVITIGIVTIINYKNKIKAQKRYDEIRSDIDKEMERYIYVIAPKCYPDDGTPLITHRDLVYNAGMDKEKFLDIDERSYCKAYVDVECIEIGKWEWNVMISCNDYEDKGFKDWDEEFEPKK